MANMGVGVWPHCPTWAQACADKDMGVRHYAVWLRCQDMARPWGIGMVMARQGQGNARG